MKETRSQPFAAPDTFEVLQGIFRGLYKTEQTNRFNSLLRQLDETKALSDGLADRQPGQSAHSYQSDKMS
jgi:hypothetical protein